MAYDSTPFRPSQAFAGHQYDAGSVGDSLPPVAPIRGQQQQVRPNAGHASIHDSFEVQQFQMLMNTAIELAARQDFTSAATVLRGAVASQQDVPPDAWASRAAEQMRQAAQCWLRSANAALSPEMGHNHLCKSTECFQMAAMLERKA